MDTIKVRVADCHDWTVENLAPEGSGRIEMSRWATGTVEADGFTATLRTPAQGVSTPRNTRIIAVVDEYGHLVDEDESAFELSFN